MEYPGHIRPEADGTKTVQTAAQHCRSTAQYAAACLSRINLSQAGYLAGLLHDLGKFQPDFQVYLEHAASGEMVKRGSVVHTFQGCRMVLERFHGETPARYEDITAELVAYAIGGHHGLFDCVDEQKRSGFLKRIAGEPAAYQESVQAFFEQCASETEIEQLFSAANEELGAVYGKIADLSERDADGAELQFYLGMLTRLLLAAVIEGDRRDTAEFMDQVVYPEGPKNLKSFWEGHLSYMEDRLDRIPGSSAVHWARQQISKQCKNFAQKPGGIYRLNVPTGAGKTLSSLRYALAHSARWEKSRIVFVSPLLSILEQNAKVIRDYIGDDSIILEHHSNVIRTEEMNETLDAGELLCESWNVPVIITTLVQLLNTFFDGKTTAIRRFQALTNSVIVIDEVQTVPNWMLTLFDLAIVFLTEICGATVVLCSATQPNLEYAAHPLYRVPEEMVPYREDIFRAFQRTELIDGGSLKLKEIPNFAQSVLEEANSLLVVCNKKDQAVSLFRMLQSESIQCFHLSAAMCVKHRRDTLQKLEQALEGSRVGGKKVLCVSTQVIEAGVDISFERVIRLAAGMDSVVQAAGRCNRNGEQQGLAPVYLLRCADENLAMLRDIETAKTATTELLTSFRRAPERFQNALESDTSIGYYYQRLYGEFPEGYQDDWKPEIRQTIFSLLSNNDGYADVECECSGKFCINQAFRLAGKAFEVFADETETVVVPYGAGKELIEELCGLGTHELPSRDWLERVKPYTVSLYQYQKKSLEPHGIFTKSGILILQPNFYDMDVGLRDEGVQFDFLEV